MAFAVGDKVTTPSGVSGEIAFGPFTAAFGYNPDSYLVSHRGGIHRVYLGGQLDAVSAYAVGDVATYSGERVRIVGGPVTGYRSGNALYLIEFISGKSAGKGNCVSESALSPVADADADTHTHGGIVYNLHSRYRDKDGDVWRLGRVDGVVRATLRGEDPQHFHNTLDSIVTSFGPLADVGEV